MNYIIKNNFLVLIVLLFNLPNLFVSFLSTVQQRIKCNSKQSRLLYKFTGEDLNDVDQRPIAQGNVKETKELFGKEWENPRNIKDIRELLTKYDLFVPVI
jgi:hypothetical protein